MAREKKISHYTQHIGEEVSFLFVCVQMYTFHSKAIHHVQTIRAIRAQHFFSIVKQPKLKLQKCQE